MSDTRRYDIEAALRDKPNAPLSEIALQFGVSKQRVHQIARQRVPEWKSSSLLNLPEKEQRRDLIARMFLNGATAKQCAVSFGVTNSWVCLLLRQRGYSPKEQYKAQRCAKLASLLAPLIERVRQGESIRSVASGHCWEGELQRACFKAGVISRHGPRKWRDRRVGK